MILSGPLGHGHAAVTEACREALLGAGGECATLDSLTLLGERRSRLGVGVFRAAMGTSLYDAFHFGQLRRDGRWCRAIHAVTRDRAYPALRDAAQAFAPEVVLAVFSTGAGLAGRLREDGLCGRAEVLVTDAVAHRLWVSPGVDRYLVTAPLTAATVRRYQPDASTTVIDLPLRAAFSDPPPKGRARAELGVPAGAPCVLLAAGGWAAAPLDRLASAIAAAGYWALALAGRNQSLLRRLTDLRTTHPTLLPVGFTTDVCSLMAASDLVVTTPGTTSSEARAVGRPLVLLDVVPGHGRENLQHELELGAEVSSLSPGSLMAAIDAVLARGQTAPGPDLTGQDRSFLSAFADGTMYAGVGHG